MLREDKASYPGDSIAEHASAIWQDFDIALIMPEALLRPETVLVQN